MLKRTRHVWFPLSSFAWSQCPPVPREPFRLFPFAMLFGRMCAEGLFALIPVVNGQESKWLQLRRIFLRQFV
jgi:hypothetical protein